MHGENDDMCSDVRRVSRGRHPPGNGVSIMDQCSQLAGWRARPRCHHLMSRVSAPGHLEGPGQYLPESSSL